MTPQKAKDILRRLEKKYPNAKTILVYSNNFELLISVMLSAQTTDLQVNKVTNVLFPKYRKANEKYKNGYFKYKNLKLDKAILTEVINFSLYDLKELENDIKSIGLYKTKANNIKLASTMLLDKFEGVIPKTIKDLTSMPGVGRKTANVVLGNAYGISEGVAVDTHVKRLSLKYGISNNTNPEKIEKDLMELFDKKDWLKITNLLIAHGRNIRKTKEDFIA